MVLRSETDEQQLKTFTVGQFHRVQRGANLAGAYFFWEALQQIVAPDREITLYAEGVLRVLAESLYAEPRRGFIPAARRNLPALRSHADSERAPGE